jgi:hypothetical protein
VRSTPAGASASLGSARVTAAISWFEKRIVGRGHTAVWMASAWVLMTCGRLATKQNELTRAPIVALSSTALALLIANLVRHATPRWRKRLSAATFILLTLAGVIVALWEAHLWSGESEMLAEGEYHQRAFLVALGAAGNAAWLEYGLSVVASLLFATAAVDLAKTSTAPRRGGLATLLGSAALATCLSGLLLRRGAAAGLMGLGIAMCTQLVVVAIAGRGRGWGAELRAHHAVIVGATLCWVGVEEGFRARALECWFQQSMRESGGATCRSSYPELVDFPAHALRYSLQMVAPVLAIGLLSLARRTAAAPSRPAGPSWLRLAAIGPVMLASALAVSVHEGCLRWLSERASSGVRVVMPFADEVAPGLGTPGGSFSDAGAITVLEPGGLRVLRQAVIFGARPLLIVRGDTPLQRLVDLGPKGPFALLTVSDETQCLPGILYPPELSLFGIIDLPHQPREIATVRAELATPVAPVGGPWCSSLSEGGLVCGDAHAHTVELELGGLTTWSHAPPMTAIVLSVSSYPSDKRLWIRVPDGAADLRSLARFVRAVRVALPDARRAHDLTITAGSMLPTASPWSLPSSPSLKVSVSVSTVETQVGGVGPYLELTDALWPCVDRSSSFAGTIEIVPGGVAVHGPPTDFSGCLDWKWPSFECATRVPTTLGVSVVAVDP